MNTKRPGGRPNDLTWHPVFVAAFAEQGTIKAACKVAGIDRHTYDEHLVKFPELARALANVTLEFVDEADRELYRRAVEGIETCVGQDAKGRPVMVTKKSDRLLEFYLKNRRREIYGDKSKVEVSGRVLMTDAEVETVSAEAEASLLLTMAAGLKGNRS